MKFLVAAFLILFSISVDAQLLSQKGDYTHADTLRGSITPERAWWNALHYDLHVKFDAVDSTLRGYNTILYKVLQPKRMLQIDLMHPLIMDSIVQNKKKLNFTRDGNAYIALTEEQLEGSLHSITAYYHGKPQVAKMPPWEGGVTWTKDSKGRPWISVTCQGLGASVWYPCKDHQYDEPDSATIHINVLKDQVGVSNGRLKSKIAESDGTVTYTWTVVSPINNYNLIPYIGAYVNFKEVYKGAKGNLDVSYWVIEGNLKPAHKHLQPEVRRMLKSLEYWFGPYPFYEDGYKIVEAPHLGMEHQSAIAYGNKYLMGYLDTDLSESGWGLKWDFIVVHESAHEWFGNNITTKELADMWVHESFANYAETLFTESAYGKKAGEDYSVGSQRGIQNNSPIIGRYNVNEEGSGDMYPKGGSMIHMIRQIINNDVKFRQILHGLNKEFYHQTVTTAQIENYISEKAGINFSKVFDQYLRTTQIPVLSYSTSKQPGYLTYLWTNCIPGFDMAVKVIEDGKKIWLHPTTEAQQLKITSTALLDKIVERNFYVKEKRE